MFSLVGQIANQTGREYIYDSHLEGGWTWEKHAQSQVTLDKIRSDQWDVVVLQEYSTRPAYDEEIVCNQTVPYLGTSKVKLYNTIPCSQRLIGKEKFYFPIH